MLRTHRPFAALLLAFGVSVATQACAAQTYGYPGGRYGGGYGRELARRAYENGYREGVEEGRNDARHNRDFSYQRHDEYRDADSGFHRSDGDINLYRRSFRSGFQAGYNESYNRYGWNNNPRGNTYPVYPGGYGYPNSYPSNRG